MKGTRLEYSPAELAFIQAKREFDRRELTARFNAEFRRCVSVENIKALCTRKQWSTGRDGRFKPGGPRHPDSGAKVPNKTSFKKGSVPTNVKPMYTERVTKDGYLEIKIPERNPYTGFKTRYRLKHLWIWEQTHSPVPKGRALAFKDGNRLNCELANLVLINRSALLWMNKNMRHSELPDDLRPSLIALAQVKDKALKLGQGKL